MTARAIVRLRGFLLLLAAAACGGGGGTVPSGGPTVNNVANGSVPLEAPYTLSPTFSDTTDHSPWSYEVDWGDGTSSTGTKTTTGAINANHTYASQGGYSVRVTVTNERGKSGQASATVSVTDPVLLTAGDIADCTRTSDDATANLLDGLAGIVVPLGDNAYLDGTATEYANCYAPTWGRHKARSRPVAGNHDYNTPNATGYFGYFGAAAGDPSKGYYSYSLGSWFVIVLNTGTDRPVDYAVGSAQDVWLRNELATHSQQCVLAMWHHPRFSTVVGRDPIRPEVGPIWNALYEYGVDLVLNGHDHAYQRFAPQTPDGVANPTVGIRQIAVGTGGGEGLYAFGPIPTGSNLEVRNNDTWGILKVTLRAGGYDWQFIPAAGGGTFTDSGSGTCHGRPS
jgi:PKD repeat protein